MLYLDGLLFCFYNKTWLEKSDIECLKVDNVEQSLAMIQSVLANQAGPAKDIVCLNAGAAIYVSGITDTLLAGVQKAQSVIADGKAAKILEGLVKQSNS